MSSAAKALLWAFNIVALLGMITFWIWTSFHFTNTGKSSDWSCCDDDECLYGTELNLPLGAGTEYCPYPIWEIIISGVFIAVYLVNIIITRPGHKASEMLLGILGFFSAICNTVLGGVLAGISIFKDYHNYDTCEGLKKIDGNCSTLVYYLFGFILMVAGILGGLLSYKIVKK